MRMQLIPDRLWRIDPIKQTLVLDLLSHAILNKK